MRLAMMADALDLGIEVAGDAWPTPEMAVASLFERGVRFLESGSELPRFHGAAEVDALATLNTTRSELLVLEAQSVFTEYVTFALTQQSDALEQTWLGLAGEHLSIRSEIVEARRTEEQLKRELAQLGAYTVPLPEHEALPSVGSDRPRKGREMYARLFEGMSAVELHLDLAEDTVERAERISEREGWSAEWGDDAPLVVFGHGLAVALREREGHAVDADDTESVRSAQAQARQRMLGLEGRYATLRYRLFELRHNVQILSWRITALQVEEQGMRARLELFRSDRERMERDLATRRAALAADPTGPDQSPSLGWRTLLNRLRRLRQ